jgi:hypothetical protein
MTVESERRRKFDRKLIITSKGPWLIFPRDLEKLPAIFPKFDAIELTLTSVTFDDCCFIFGLSAETGRLLIPKRLVGGGLPRRPFRFGIPATKICPAKFHRTHEDRRSRKGKNRN